VTFFTYVSGIVTILGFLMQLRDVFPAHREIRKTILLLVTGTFLGSIVGSLQGIQLTIQAPDNPLLLLGYIVLTLLAAILFVAAIASLLAIDNNRRAKINEFLISGFFAFIFLVFLAAAGSGLTSKTSPSDFSIDELMALSNDAITHKNFDRAIAIMEMAKSKLPASDSRSEMIYQKIEELKKLQISPTTDK
jgi:hypothetical protein